VKRRIGDDLDGFGQLIGVLTELAGAQHLEVPVAMETANGLLAASLLDAGYSLFAINPLAVSRYRDRYSPSRAKSDAADAYVLANILRTDPAAHRPVPADSEQAKAIRVLARAQQDAVWERQQAQAKLRSLLREYYPAFLAAFPDLRSWLPSLIWPIATRGLHSRLRPRRRQRPDCVARACGQPLRATGDSATSIIKWSASSPSCGWSTCVSQPASRPRCRHRHWPTCVPSMQRLRMRPHWRHRLLLSSPRTTTPRSSPACPDWAQSWPLAFLPSSATITADSPTLSHLKPSPAPHR